MFKTVLIALNNSPLDQVIMATTAQLILEPGAKVIMAHVLPYAEDAAGQDASRPLPPDHEFPHQQLEQHLSTCAQQLTDIEPVIELTQGDPNAEIIRLANIYRVDLIILGSRGLTGVNRILAGSVSGLVVEEAPCTVMVVKPPA